MIVGSEWLWYDSISGRWRRVRVVDVGRRLATVEYFSNDQRTERIERGGRRAVRATRVRVRVYRDELKQPEEGLR